MMDASLDTDIVVHLYKSGKKELLFSFCNKLYMHWYLLENELKGKSYSVYQEVVDDTCNGSIKIVTGLDLARMGVKNLFNRYVEKDGYDNAMMYSAKPRHSEHETGLAFDIGGADQALWLKDAFEATEEGIWLKENAHRFGFILRYPKGKTDITGYIYEPWHFRYIGIEDARKIYELDITLEEYLLH